MNVLVVGGGKVGRALGRLLIDGGQRVTVIEARAELVERLRHDIPGAAIVHGSGTAPAVLESAGIHQADVVAAVTGADETNLVVASLSRYAFGVPRTIARVNNPKNTWIYTGEMGVDVALNQADLMARLIVEELAA